VVAAGGSQFVTCAAGDVRPVTAVATPEQYRIWPGTIELIGIEVVGWNETDFGGLIGFGDRDLRPMR
jgi:hypothetical protein